MTNTSSSTSAAERAYQEIREQILDGTHQPGTMLGENALATDLEVSRTPIRVALARLQDEGWIVIYPKRGALVQGMSERMIAELAEARLLLETTAVDRASTESRQRLADRLERSIAAQRDALNQGDLRGFIDLTLEFHRGFVEAGGNTVLLELYAQLSDRHRFVLFAAGARLLSRGADIITEHAKLTEYLRSGDAAAFAKMLRDHIAENSPPAALGRDATDFLTT